MDDFDEELEGLEEGFFEEEPDAYYGGYGDDDYVSADSEYEDEC